MVAVANQLAPSVEWRDGVAESLPFPDQSFDIVVSQFGLMFFTDRRQALREMYRVLAADGRLAIAVWDSIDNMPAYAAEVALLERTAGRKAADALCAPFVLGNRNDLVTLFSEAGIPSAQITTLHGTAHFPNIRTMVEADLRGWLPVMGITLTEDQIGHILQEAEQGLSSYASADGRATSSYRRISSLRRRISMAVTGSFLFNHLAKVIGGAFGGLLSNTLRASRTFASTSDGQ
jgi:SAM-dependent methyltransferase